MEDEMIRGLLLTLLLLPTYLADLTYRQAEPLPAIPVSSPSVTRTSVNSEETRLQPDSQEHTRIRDCALRIWEVMPAVRFLL